VTLLLILSIEYNVPGQLVMSRMVQGSWKVRLICSE